MNTAVTAQEPQPETLIEKLRIVHTATKEDYRQTNLRGKITLGSLALMTAYEWGPGNETLTPIIGGQAIDAAQGIGGALVTATITGGFTYAQQLTSSWLSRRSAEQFPTTSQKAFDIMNGSDVEQDEEMRFKSFEDLSFARKSVYSFIMGSSFNVLREAAVTGTTDQQQLRSVGRKSAAITAGAVAGLALAADVVDQAAPEGSIIKSVVEFAKTPWPYLAFMGGFFAKDAITTRLHRKQRAK